MSDKPSLRRSLREARARWIDQLGSHGRAEAEQALVDRLSAHLDVTSVLAAYSGVGAELRLEGLFSRTTSLALPHVTALDQPLRFLRWSLGEPLVDGPFGLRQPDGHAPEVSPSVILAPLVGFDRRAGRLGQGGGFYDRAFARYRDARRIGIAWRIQECRHVPLDPWDMPLHAVATEDEWIEMP